MVDYGRIAYLQDEMRNAFFEIQDNPLDLNLLMKMIAAQSNLIDELSLAILATEATTENTSTSPEKTEL